MTPDGRLDRDLPARLSDLGGTAAPDYLDDILGRTVRTRQRPAWTFPGRWFPMTLRASSAAISPPVPRRLVWLLVLVALVTVSVVVGSAIIGSRGLTPPHKDSGFPAAVMLPTACPAGTQLKSGDIATIAGTGRAASTADGGPALAADVSTSYGGLTVDTGGAVYLGDASGHSVRRIGTDGIITNYSKGFDSPNGLAFDDAGDLFVADYNAGRVWKVDPTGSVTTAVTIGPVTLAIDPAGDLYWDGENMYRETDPTGVSKPFAGTGSPGYSGDGGPATKATLGLEVLGVAVGPHGDVYLGDPGNDRLRKVDPAGIITTFAGTGQQGNTGDGGPAAAAEIGKVTTIAADETGNVYFVDRVDNVVRKVDPQGFIITVAGTGAAGFAGDCGPASAAELNQPFGVAVHDGVVYITDEGNYRIRMVVP